MDWQETKTNTVWQALYGDVTYTIVRDGRWYFVSEQCGEFTLNWRLPFRGLSVAQRAVFTHATMGG